MKTLILIVESNESVKKTMIEMFNGVSYMFTSTLEEAIANFKHNQGEISHIVLDYNVVSNRGEPVNTVVLAEIIAKSHDFKGEIFLISSDEHGSDELMRILGKKCQSFVLSTASIKKDAINEIIRRVKEVKIKPL